MVESWLDEYVGEAGTIRPEFERGLEDRLTAAWHDDDVYVTPVERALSPARGRRGRTAVWLGVAAAVIIACVVLATRPSHKTLHPTGPTLGTEPAQPTNRLSSPASSPSPTRATSPTPTADSSPATASASTIGPGATILPGQVSVHGGGTLAIPDDGGPTIAPTVLTTLAPGTGPGQLTLQDGEFATSLAVLPDSILVPEDTPFNGLTGRVLVLDRAGTWERDVHVPSLVGNTILWTAGSPNGTLFVISAAGNASSGSEPSESIQAFRVDASGDLTLVKSEPTDWHMNAYADTPDHPVLTPSGLDIPSSGTVMSIDTGVVDDDAVTMNRITLDDDSVRATVIRGTPPGTAWTLSYNGY
ncbi:MAG TPA: hypothetical protein VGM78_16280, partial [Ilumatobacteraceae bacterium]